VLVLVAGVGSFENLREAGQHAADLIGKPAQFRVAVGLQVSQIACQERVV
jgi:hypothetical protein